MKRIVFGFLMCGIAVMASSLGWSEKIAVVKLNSYYACNINLSAIKTAMADRGYSEGVQVQFTEFDAQGDLDALADLASGVVQDDYDLIISLSTPALQAVANANVDTHVPHVFAFVTSAYIADVGVTQDGVKPDYMTGISNPNPVKEAFALAREMFPELNKVGLVYNTAETNSVYQTGQAREICAELEIELLEATADSSDQVIGKVEELIQQGIQAIYVNGESTVRYVIGQVTALTTANGIPVYTVGSGGVEQGTLFDLGPNYEQVGYVAGEMAAAILGGQNPADILAINYVTETLYLNLNVQGILSDPWQITDDMIDRANLVIGLSGACDWELYQ
jgi:putative tryptophan/tyrosine transport system substrate-binding protein